MHQSTKTVFITGASSGIGRATALHLHQQGWHVFAGVRRPQDGQTLQAETSSRLQPILLDVTDHAQIDTAVNQITQHLGKTQGLDALINNAGISITEPLACISIDKLRHQLEVNTIAPIAVTQAFLPLLRPANGRIINISSGMGRMSIPFAGPYSASKHALETLSDTLRMELKDEKIAVILIEPGSIATEIWHKAAQNRQNLSESWSTEDQQRYGTRYKNFARMNDELTKILPQHVAAVILRALTAKRPSPRYLVGADVRFALILNWLPTRWRDTLLLKLLDRNQTANGEW